MKLSSFFLQLLVFCCFSTNTWGFLLDDLHENEEVLLESADTIILSYKALLKDEKGLSEKKSAISRDTVFKRSKLQEFSVKEAEGLTPLFSKDKQINARDNTDFYLFSQKELDAQKPGLELYQTLSPMLTPEMKKDAKKIWSDSADFREAINFSTMENSKKLILHQSANDMTLFKGKTLTGISNANQPRGVLDSEGSDKILAKVLIDDFHELLKNALLIIVVILIFGKLTGMMLTTLTKSSKRRKKRKVRGRRRKLRRNRARFKMG